MLDKTNYFSFVNDCIIIRNMKPILYAIIVLLTASIGKAQTLHGFIKDKDSRKAIALCNVILYPSMEAVLTDDNGRFSITTSPQMEPSFMVFYAYGYASDTLYIQKGKTVYNHYLKAGIREAILDNVVITGATRATLIKENPISISSVSTRQIESTTEGNIIDALVKNVPGLNAVKTGPNISKPFIHGLGYNRVLTLYDGIRQEGQQYGDEHGLEVDDYNLEKAEVIKGPASLLYGSDAIAGVISLYAGIPDKKDKKLHGKLTHEYQTNNNLVGNGFRLDYSGAHFITAIRGSHRMAKNYRNAIDGRVYLTNFAATNLSILSGYKTDKSSTQISATLYDNHQGIPDGSRDSMTRKFTHQVYEGDDDDITQRPIVSHQALNSYTIPDLAQHIQHYRLYLHHQQAVGEGDIDILLGGQQNKRREYTHPQKPQQAGMYMRLNTLNYGLRYNAPKLLNIETSIGINGMLQNNKNKEATDFPIPDYHIYDGGAYGYAKWKHEKWTISGGMRYDVRYVQWNDFYVGIHSETGFTQQVHNPQAAGATLQFKAYEKWFQGMSGSVGVTYIPNDAISLKANIARAYRAPNVTEIGSNGLDPGAHIIYLGNRNFQPEFSLQEDMGIHVKYPNFSAEGSLFHNQIQNYIYMSAVVDANGNLLLDAQGNRTYQYQQAAAQLYGAEAWLAFHPEKIKGLRWDNSMSVVYGFNRKAAYKNKGVEGAYLPLIPPLKINSSLSYERNPSGKWIASITPKVEMEYHAQQNRYLALNSTETYTPSYTLWHIGISTDIRYYKTSTLQVIVQANNIFDKAYQSHLSRLKYFEYYQNSTNGSYGIYNMGRNIALKIIARF